MAGEQRNAGGTGVIRSKIMKCKCAHAFQDSRYGIGMRVHRHVPAKQKGLDDSFRCTVCEPIRARRRLEQYLKGLPSQGRLS